MSSPDLRMPAAPAYPPSSIASDVSLGDNNSVYPPIEYNNTVCPPVGYNKNVHLPVPPLPFGKSSADHEESSATSFRLEMHDIPLPSSISSNVPWRDSNNAYIPVEYMGSTPSNMPWRDNIDAYIPVEYKGSIPSNIPWRDNIDAFIPVEYNNNVYAPIQSLQIDESTDEISEILGTMNNLLIRTVHSTRSPTSKPWTICPVPAHLRKAHEHVFDPMIISIGPFHRHQPHLAVMEEHKTRFLLRLLNSMKLNGTTSPTLDESAESNNEAIFINTSTEKEFLAAMMKELQADAEACYASYSSNYFQHDFVVMLILDGCFVVELLRLYAKCDKENDDPIFSNRWMVPKLQHDLLLFENQLPYFVLEKIFEITSSEEEKRKSVSLAQLALNFFDPLLPREKKLLEKCTLDAKTDHYHLLGLFRSSFLSSFKDGKSTTSQADNNNRSTTTNASIIDVPPAVEKRQLIHCVSELKEAGIIFKKRKNHGLLDIEFKNGKLYIPPISIDDHTNPVFLNFIAYEQCNINAEPYFTHYFLFLDSLVNSSKDVEHLHHRGIIDHVLGSDEDVADLFNKLCKEVVHDVNNCYLSQVLKDVNKYFHIKRHKWWATWKHDYFRNPWAISSFLAAILLILLTAIQSFFSVYAYFLPPSNKGNPNH